LFSHKVSLCHLIFPTLLCSRNWPLFYRFRSSAWVTWPWPVPLPPCDVYLHSVETWSSRFHRCQILVPRPPITADRDYHWCRTSLGLVWRILYTACPCAPTAVSSTAECRFPVFSSVFRIRNIDLLPRPNRSGSVLPTFVFRVVENTVWWKWNSPRLGCAKWTPEGEKKRSVSRWACKNNSLLNSLCNLPDVLVIVDRKATSWGGLLLWSVWYFRILSAADHPVWTFLFFRLLWINKVKPKDVETSFATWKEN